MALYLKPLAGLFQKGYLNSILIFLDIQEVHKTNKIFLKNKSKLLKGYNIL